MKRLIVLLCCAVGLMLLCGCQSFSRVARTPEPTAETVRHPVPASELIHLSFSEGGSFFKRVQGYEFCAEGDTYTALFWMANEEEPFPMAVDQQWVDTLTGFVGQYGIMDWDGFHGSAPDLLDGTQFSIDLTFADGTAVHAGGYGKFPVNYGDASSAIDAHFMQLLPEDMRDW